MLGYITEVDPHAGRRVHLIRDTRYGEPFATKQVHVKHYRLILWVPGFVDVPRLL